uniref:TBCC domain-containing protein n=1 Tax=Steinernema glaseri TaxID=37863 RepID=A0A1I7ZXP6_9BILA
MVRLMRLASEEAQAAAVSAQMAWNSAQMAWNSAEDARTRADAAAKAAQDALKLAETLFPPSTGPAGPPPTSASGHPTSPSTPRICCCSFVAQSARSSFDANSEPTAPAPNRPSLKLQASSNVTPVVQANIEEEVSQVSAVEHSYFVFCSGLALAAAARQIRIHDTTYLNLHVSIRGVVIIERSLQVRVAPYLMASGLIISTELPEEDKWDDVHDFNWLPTSRSSPAWCKMEEDRSQAMSQQYADGTSSLSPRVGRTAGSIVEDLIATNVIPQDHNGAIYVIDTTTSYFAKAIVMMSKIGDNLYLVPASEGLYVKGLNDARTVVGGFLFRTNYFCYSDTSRLDATRSANMCRLSMKSAVATFHSIGERKPCSSLVLFLDPKGDTMKVIFYVNCDVVKTHELRLRETTTTFKRFLPPEDGGE